MSIWKGPYLLKTEGQHITLTYGVTNNSELNVHLQAFSSLTVFISKLSKSGDAAVNVCSGIMCKGVAQRKWLDNWTPLADEDHEMFCFGQAATIPSLSHSKSKLTKYIHHSHSNIHLSTQITFKPFFLVTFPSMHWVMYVVYSGHLNSQCWDVEIAHLVWKCVLVLTAEVVH